MTIDEQATPDAATAPGEEEERLPSLAEQMAQQLGGWRGLVESSIPVVVFVVSNVVTSLNPALIAAVSVAVALAAVRLWQRKPIRHALNGLFGVGLGAYLAWRSGNAKAFYLPGIYFSLGYGLAMLASVAIRQPLVGWVWAMLVAGGRSDWRNEPRMVRLFSWLTVLWAVVYLTKAVVQNWLFQDHGTTANTLGMVRLAMGYPPYALLLFITVWTVRRHARREPAAA